MEDRFESALYDISSMSNNSNIKKLVDIISELDAAVYYMDYSDYDDWSASDEYFAYLDEVIASLEAIVR